MQGFLSMEIHPVSVLAQLENILMKALRLVGNVLIIVCFAIINSIKYYF